MTRKEYERYLNNLHGVDYTRFGSTGRYGASTRPYGTYLRAADPEMFEAEYQAHIKAND